jgi:Domain of unknown function (DUF4920)
MKTLFLTFLTFAVGLAGEVRLGKPFTINEAMGIDKLTAAPEKYVGKVVQVKGTVRDVCRMMGCWMELADPESGKSIRIKVKDGEITFPKEAIGKTAIAEGKLAKVELTKEQAIAQAKHEAEANGRKFDPASITSAVTFYQIQGTGAVITE